MDWVTRQHLGIIFVVAGTAFLAFSVRVKRQPHDEFASVVDALKKKYGNDILELTDTSINRFMFWFGLVLVALGSLLQW